MIKSSICLLAAVCGLLSYATSAPSPLSKAQGRDIDFGPVYNVTCLQNGNMAASDCDKYYNCYNGLAHMMKCQQNWLFDLVYTGCNYPEMTDCGNRTRPEGYPTAPTQGSTQTTLAVPFTCPASGGTYPHPTDCSLYIVCINWTPIVNKCPTGLVFNPATSQCDWPASVPGC